MRRLPIAVGRPQHPADELLLNVVAEFDVVDLVSLAIVAKRFTAIVIAAADGGVKQY